MAKENGMAKDGTKKVVKKTGHTPSKGLGRYRNNRRVKNMLEKKILKFQKKGWKVEKMLQEVQRLNEIIKDSKKV